MHVCLLRVSSLGLDGLNGLCNRGALISVLNEVRSKEVLCLCLLVIWSYLYFAHLIGRLPSIEFGGSGSLLSLCCLHGW